MLVIYEAKLQLYLPKDATDDEIKQAGHVAISEGLKTVKKLCLARSGWQINKIEVAPRVVYERGE